MLREYFELIRSAISQNRKRGDNYYESHHIVPKSFLKKSEEVLLTAEEHYQAHKILAESFKNHPIYGRKMLWAFHRMTYNNGRKITQEEYAEARTLLMSLWKRSKSNTHRENIGKSRKGKRWVYNTETGESRQVNNEELQGYLDTGWSNTHKHRSSWIPTDEQRKNYSEAAKNRPKRVGKDASRNKGAVVCENIHTGVITNAESAFELSKILGNIHYSVIHEILNGDSYDGGRKPRSKRSKYYDFIQSHKIYYKE